MSEIFQGLILDKDNDYEPVAYPYKKFFNFNEPQGRAIAEVLDWDAVTVYEKLDGQLCTVYFYDNQWQVASSGTFFFFPSHPTKKILNHNQGTPDACGFVCGITFANLFWQIWGKLGYKKPERCHSHITFIFEMLSPRATIIVVPASDSIVLHGARDMNTLEELQPLPLAEEYGWQSAKAFDHLRSMEDVQKAAAALNPIKDEGFVICDGMLLKWWWKSFFWGGGLLVC